MGGGWNNIGVVAFLYINNFSDFPCRAGRTSKEVGVPENTPPGKPCAWQGWI